MFRVFGFRDLGLGAQGLGFRVSGGVVLTKDLGFGVYLFKSTGG